MDAEPTPLRPSRTSAMQGRPKRPSAVGTASHLSVATAEPATILIRGLAARTFIGITAAERAKRQDVTIDLKLDVTTRAGRTDRIGDAVDYKTVKDVVLDYVEETEHNLLESLAQGIADLILVHSDVQSVEVEVDKPGALRFARSVAVRIRRDHPPRPKRAPRNWGHRG